MGQSVIATFKAYYVFKTYLCMNHKSTTSLEEFWKGYSWKAMKTSKSWLSNCEQQSCLAISFTALFQWFCWFWIACWNLKHCVAWERYLQLEALDFENLLMHWCVLMTLRQNFWKLNIYTKKQESKEKEFSGWTISVNCKSRHLWLHNECGTKQWMRH